MHLLVPANSKQLTDRAFWFKSPIARKLAQEKEVEFGFELKGEPETINPSAGGVPPLFWAYHLPGEFASEWYYHPEKRGQLLSRISHIASFNPAYVNIHGIHLWWQPPSSEHIHHYLNHSQPVETLKILEATIDLIKELKKIFKFVRVENFPLCNFYEKAGRLQPETHLYTGAGRLNDLFYIKKRAEVEIILDLEHLILTLNFLKRVKNYRHIPIIKITKPSREDEEIRQIFGFYIPQDGYPYSENKLEISKIIKKFGAKYYHLTGSVQDVNPGKRILTHGPIEKNDRTFRQHLRLILAQSTEVLVMETADSRTNPCYHYLRPNETELSFYHLCEILLEEL